MKCYGSERKGFMLLIVVTMLAIVCLLFYQLAQVALGTMQTVAEREKEIRERWTLVSTRKAVLPQVSAVLTTQERQANLAQTELQQSAGAIYFRDCSLQLEINGMPVRMAAKDESARLHVPGLLRIRPRTEAGHLIERLQEGRSLPVRRDALEKESAVPTSWRDVFDVSEAGSQSLQAATDRITLWGSGRLNVFRADEEVVSECWREMFGHFPPRELMDARNVYPPLEWSTLRQRLNLREEQLTLADASLSTQSDCFSVRITLGSDPDTQQRYLFVADRNSQHFGFEE